MSKKATFAALIKWRWEDKFPKGWTAAQIANSFSCESLHDANVPAWLRSAVTAFRHLTQKVRTRTVQSYLDRPTDTKPRKRLRGKSIFAVCGYQAKRCESIKEANEWVEDRLGRTTYPSAFIVQGELTVIEKVTEWPLKRTVLK